MFITDNDNNQRESRKGLAFLLMKRFLTGLTTITTATAALFGSYCITGAQSVYADEIDVIESASDNEEETSELVESIQYTEEYEDSMVPVYATSPAVSKTVNIRHVHTGNEEYGGGCYSKESKGYQEEEVKCGGTLHYWPDLDTSQCSNCGASYSGNRGGQDCPHSHMESREYTYYELGCNKSTGTVTGTFTVTLDTKDWTKKVISVASYKSTNGLRVQSPPFTINGTNYSNGTREITKNGTYNFSLRTDSNSNQADAKISLKVSNIDIKSPTVKKTSLSPEGWTRDNVTFSLDEVTDVQEDGTQGSGLAAEPYSFDGGLTYTSSNTKICDENGAYKVIIKDMLDNETEYVYTVDHIDRHAPNINRLEFDDTKGLDSVTLGIVADDLDVDGKNGSGIAIDGYSFDGGQTWTSLSAKEFNHNGVIKVAVKDNVGNISYDEVAICNVDDSAPVVSHTILPDTWTNTDVVISYEAKDINIDGSEGIGLPTDCYRYDDVNWTEDNTYTATQNGTYNVSVRDLSNKETQYSVEIGNIDKIAPLIVANSKLASDAKSARLNIKATDEESGIALDSIQWLYGGKCLRSGTITVTENGRYIAIVRDIAGNEARATLDVNGIKGDEEPGEDAPEPDSPNPPDDIIEPEDEKDPPVVPPTPPVVPRKPNIITPTDEQPIYENKVVIPSTKEKKLEKKLTEKKAEPANRLEKKSFMARLLELETWKLVALALLVLIILLLLLLLLILWYRSVAVYNYVDDRRQRFVTLKWISRKEGSFYILMTDDDIRKCESTQYMFVFSWAFTLMHKGEDIYIQFPEEQMRLEHISRKINLIIR